jgi:hypothetical protein
MREATCVYCNGAGTAQTLMERTDSGEWVPNTMIDHAMADAWIAADVNAPVRWEECACPVCDGAGCYMIEFPRCKIF